jgi:aspartate/methionine/tyrosine aminotransferase
MQHYLKDNKAQRDQLTLTHFERKAFSAMLNLADGHVRRQPTPGESKVMSNLQSIYEQSLKIDPVELEARLVKEQLAVCGQVKPNEITPLVFFSGSEALGVVGEALAVDCKTAAVVEPTFDNIPHLIYAAGVEVTPFSEELMAKPRELEGIIRKYHSLVITLPNNPSGISISKATLVEIAKLCASHNTALMIDASFRSYSTNKFDFYAVLTGTKDLDWMVLEDTGKLWAANDLKAGILMCSERFFPKASELFHDLILSISPFVLLLLAELAREAGKEAVKEVIAHIQTNRSIVREGLKNSPIFQPDTTDSQLSVERLYYDEKVYPDQRKLLEHLTSKGLALTGSGGYYWAGTKHKVFVRLALARDKSAVERAVAILAKET